MPLFFTSFVPRLTGDFRRIVKETPAFAKKLREHYVPTVAAWIEVNLGVDLQAESAPAPPPTRPRLQLRPAEQGALELELRDLRVELAPEGQGWVLKVPGQGPGLFKPEASFATSLDNYLAGFVARSESQFKRVMAARGVSVAIHHIRDVRPKALPPARSTPWTRSTRCMGRSRSVSRVPGAPPR